MDRDMDMDMDMHMVKSRCFASSFKKVPTKNSICGSSSLWALSGLTNPRFLPTRGMCMYLSALSFGVRRPILVWINEACASRVVAEHPSGAARHGGNATFLPCTPHTCPPPPSPTRPRTHGGVWSGTPSLGRPRERRPLFVGAFTCLDRSGWARRVRPGGLDGPPMGMS